MSMSGGDAPGAAGALTGAAIADPDPAGSGRPSAMWSVRRPDGTVATGWFLLPLRLFLGVTYLVAGLQKLADPQFFHDNSPTSIHAQLLATVHSSPIHALTSHLLPYSTGVGLAIAIGEVAVGVGVLVGLWTRVAAVAGALISLSLFLTVSFHASPYYTGSDIVFLFAWTPLILAGAAGAPALDTWLADRAQGTAETGGGVPRRTVLSKGLVTGVVAGMVVALGGLTAALGRLAGGTDEPTTRAAGATGDGASAPPPSAPPASTQTTAGTKPATDPSGIAVVTASSVPVGGSATFTDPQSGDPSLIIQRAAGEFVAYDAVCPHEGCTVAYQPSAKIIACPCHGSEFNPRTGAVVHGPAPNGLTKIPIVQGANGSLYVPK